MRFRSSRSPWRWSWTLPVAAVALVTACDNSLGASIQDDTWGFITVDATKTAAGEHRVSPKAVFFLGRLASVPNASLVLDSCIDVLFNSDTTILGVTYLDAGEPVTTKFPLRTPDTLPRQSTGSIFYQLPSGTTLPYHPGDSIEVTVPGVSGGYPQVTVKAKTSEAFTMSPITVPTGTDAIQLRWTAPDDQTGAMIVELRYGLPGSSSISREALCAFTDDGVDSIPFRQYTAWAATNNAFRDAVSTRLRTTFTAPATGNAVLEVISKYSVPTPVP